ncbi:MAG: hypothetical protein QOJ71_1564, partial [Actinomycetota bacterium]|nr:hypothetical protein [Actinomycetota bacterium]
MNGRISTGRDPSATSAPYALCEALEERAGAGRA